MARNVEIKARVSDIADLMGRSKHLATSGPTVIHQDDTFFGCASGRMKLRAFQEGSGYQSRINAALRMEVERNLAARPRATSRKHIAA